MLIKKKQFVMHEKFGSYSLKGSTGHFRRRTLEAMLE